MTTHLITPKEPLYANLWQMKNTESITHNTCIPDHMEPMRLDQALAKLCPEFSRSRLQQWIKQEKVLLNGSPCRARDRVVPGDKVQICALLETAILWQGQAMDLDIIYQDDDLFVINKPRNQVVHPGAGNPDGTLVNAILHQFPELSVIPRAGVVHRLDKDTSGLLVCAKTIQSHGYLVDLLQQRKVKREYEAIVYGDIISGSTIDLPIGRHPHQRTKMAVATHGKPAVTHYRIIKRYGSFTHLKISLETGRTHQIRVHLAHKKHPIVGDLTYGGPPKFPKNCPDDLHEYLKCCRQQMLHARRLGLAHPTTGENCLWESPLPDDMTSLRDLLTQNFR